MKKGIRCIRPAAMIALLTVLLLGLTACQESTSSKYDRANKLVSEGKYMEAVAVFDEISSYEDSSKMSMYAKAINAAENGNYETAFSTFRNLGDFKDCPMMITYYTARQAEASVYDGAWIYGDKWFEAIELYESNPLFRDSADRAENCRKAAYDQAVTSGDQGDTRFAVSVLKKLGSYSDSPKQKTYYEAKAFQANGQYREASEKYAAIPGFRDADAQVTGVIDEGYEAAAAKEKAGDLDAAHKIFLNLGDYKDSATRAYKLYYDAAVRMREEKDWEGAKSAFEKAGDYSDAGAQIKETTYQEASALEAAGDQEGAYRLFISLDDYRDSFDRANKPYYDLGIKKRDAGEWESARSAFEHAGEYSDAPEQIPATYYAEGEAKRTAGDWDGARAAFENAGVYSDAGEQTKETTYQEAAALELSGDQEGAYQLFISLNDYRDSFDRANKPYYDLGIQKKDSGEWDAARSAFEHAGEYGDAPEQILAAYYAEGEEKRAAGDWDGAKEAFRKAGDYSDADEQVKETIYQEAAAYYASGDIRHAYNTYLEIIGYKDVDNLLVTDNKLTNEAQIIRKEQFSTVGNTVTFGKYHQTANGNDQTPIEWIVLDYDRDNHRVLLISRYIVEKMQYYSSDDSNIIWESCPIRKWLNESFYNTAFSAEEKKAIILTSVDNDFDRQSGYEVAWGNRRSYGNSTMDKLYLLSNAEADYYMGTKKDDTTYYTENNEKGMAAPTEWAVQQGLYLSYLSTSDWWLRSSEYKQSGASIVDSSGWRSAFVRKAECGIRPVLWVDLECDVPVEYMSSKQEDKWYASDDRKYEVKVTSIKKESINAYKVTFQLRVIATGNVVDLETTIEPSSTPRISDEPVLEFSKQSGGKYKLTFCFDLDAGNIYALDINLTLNE